jgi:RNA recognition motif-containing protein
MIVLIKNLPINFKEAELRELVAPYMKLAFIFPLWGRKVKKTSIFYIREEKNNHFVYYGVVTLSHKKAGLRVIKKLNGKRFRNRVLEVREFFIRSKHNDRRLTSGRLEHEVNEKRKGERRRDISSDSKQYASTLTGGSNVFDRENVYLPTKRRGDY